MNQRKANLLIKYSSFLILLIISTISVAQSPPEKFGKINIKDLDIDVCPIDSGANAYFIFDYGYSCFKYPESHIRYDDAEISKKGFQLYTVRHFRIKILDKSAADWANIVIYLFGTAKKERLVSIRANTYNLDGGKIIKQKLEKKNIYEEKVSKFWLKKKALMPNVREGSVIEVEYTIISDFLSYLNPWYFQHTIPVLKSEYDIIIPEYYNYNKRESGYFNIEKGREERFSKMTLTFYQKPKVHTLKVDSHSETYNFREDIFHYSINNVPAFQIEKYLRSAKNYRSKVEFEIQSSRLPYSEQILHASSWENIIERYLTNEYFGLELKRSAHLKNDVEKLKQTNQNDEQLLNSAFHHIQNKMGWSEVKSEYVTKSLSYAYKKGEGNCADINLNLVAFLKELGFESYPVILSTQKNGLINMYLPSVYYFNYVIAMVILNGKVYLMDATDPFSEINLLPKRCLNDVGRIVKKGGGEWINLMNIKKYNYVEYRKIIIDENLQFLGDNSLKLKEYASYDYRKKIKEYSSYRDYKDYIEDNANNLYIDNLVISGLDTLTEHLDISYKFKQSDIIQDSEEMAYFSPVYEPFFENNDFIMDDRKYPVEFDHPYLISQTFFYTIPNNYELLEIPKSMIVELPDKSAKYIFSINKFEKNISVTSKISINKSLYLSQDYKILKIFYQYIIDKQKEMIVLKKIN